MDLKQRQRHKESYKKGFVLRYSSISEIFMNNGFVGEFRWNNSLKLKFLPKNTETKENFKVQIHRTAQKCAPR